MTASMHLVHEGCGSGHLTVGGADNDLRNALQMAADRVTGGALLSPTPEPRAVVSLKTQDKCGLNSSGLILIGLSQESDREGEVVS